MKKLLPIIALVSVLALTQCGKQKDSQPSKDIDETAGYTNERMKEFEGAGHIEMVQVEEELPGVFEVDVEEFEGYVQHR